MIFKDKLLFDLLNKVSYLEDEINILKKKVYSNENSGAASYVMDEQSKYETLPVKNMDMKVSSSNDRANRNDVIKILNHIFKNSDLNFKKSNEQNKILVTDINNTTISNIKIFNSKEGKGSKNKIWTSWHTVKGSDIDEHDIFIFTIKIKNRLEMFLLSHSDMMEVLTKKEHSDRHHFKIFKSIDEEYFDEYRLLSNDPINFNKFYNNMLPFQKIKS